MSTTTCVSIAAVFLLAVQNGSVPARSNEAHAAPPPFTPELELRAPGQSGVRVGDQRRLLTARADRDPDAAALSGAEVDPTAASSGIAPSPLPQVDTVVDIGSGVRIELVFVPPGQFRMGSNDGQADEFPVRRVTIRRGFLIGKYEVTQQQWLEVMGSNPSSFTGSDELPVERVSWEDCQEFIRRLNERTEGGWRLPTEAEWEYACRAGTTGEFSGDVESLMWHQENSGLRPHEVGSKQPNPWGLHDMHGNVWEWCQDWYDPGSYGRRDEAARTGPTSGSFRVARGGSWYDDALFSRSANRNGTPPKSRSVSLGLRLVRSF